MTRSLYPLWREWRIFILTWAMRERLTPCHPDLPRAVLELHAHMARR